MKKITVLVLVMSLSCGLFSQNRLSKFEGFIIKGFRPESNPVAYPDVYSQFEDNMRTIQWHEDLSKDYLYSNQAFDTLGYEALVSNENTDTKTYRNCFKGIIVDIKEYEGQLSITMSWFPLEGRNGIGNLFTCSEFIGTWQQTPDTSKTKTYLMITKSGENFGFQTKTAYGSFFKMIPLRYKNGFDPLSQQNTLESYSSGLHVEVTYNTGTQRLTWNKREYIKVE